jgi:hypothetical protein
MCIRDLRGNNMMKLSAKAFDWFPASTTVYLQNNNITCYPEASAQIRADVMQCVSLNTQSCTSNVFCFICSNVMMGNVLW